MSWLSRLGSALAGSGSSSSAPQPQRPPPPRGLTFDTHLCLASSTASPETGEDLVVGVVQASGSLLSSVTGGSRAKPGVVLPDDDSATIAFRCVALSASQGGAPKQMATASGGGGAERVLDGMVVTVWTAGQGGKCLKASPAAAGGRGGGLAGFAQSLFRSGSTSAPSAAQAVATAAAPTEFQLSWEAQDSGEACWFVVRLASGAHRNWECRSCSHPNTAGQMTCASCRSPRPLGRQLVVGDAICLCVFANPACTVAVPASSHVLAVSAEASSAASAFACRLAASARRRQQQPAQQQQERQSLSFVDRAIVTGAVSAMGAMAAAATATATANRDRPPPRTQSERDAALFDSVSAAAAPHVHRAAQDRYSRDPSLFFSDVRTAVRVVDAISSHPATQHVAAAAAAGVAASLEEPQRRPR